MTVELLRCAMWSDSTRRGIEMLYGIVTCFARKVNGQWFDSFAEAQQPDKQADSCFAPLHWCESHQERSKTVSSNS